VLDVALLEGRAEAAEVGTAHPPGLPVRLIRPRERTRARQMVRVTGAPGS
jgi:hypothetical protein